MSTPYPLTNGVRHSWASVEIKLGDDIILGITEINYKDTLDPGIVKGAGPRPIAFTLGSYEADGDFTILLEEFNTLIQKLGAGWKSVQFEIIVTYDESGSGLSTIVDTLKGCRITSTEGNNSSANADATVRKLPIKCLDILWNGVSSVPAQPSVSS
jgi:hypothetical protein